MMNCWSKLFLALALAACLTACETRESATELYAPSPSPLITVAASPTASPSPLIPNLQAEILDGRSITTAGPIGRFDFRNYTYELPRGWQNPDGSTEITLVNGRVAPVSADISDKMSDEEKSEAKNRRRIGLSFVTVKYLAATGDGQDDAAVALKIETGGAAIPQIVYVFTWKNGGPELVWPFRTGDRADGGLKDIRAENGELVIELYGQDRFILGQTETGKITGDEEQLCCPTHFTRSAYRWNGNAFLMTKKRLTFSITDKNAPPVENLGDKVNAPGRKK